MFFIKIDKERLTYRTFLEYSLKQLYKIVNNTKS